MLDAYGGALTTLAQPINMLVMIIGVLGGLIVGVIPTLGGMTIMAILLPFIFVMPSAETALILLIAVYSVTATGGAVTSILVNIPGTGVNAATLLDGYPMNQRGEGDRAIGAAVMASMAGGIFPVFLALAMIPLIMAIIRAFGQPEMAVLILVGISFLALLGSGSPSKGMLCGLTGLLISLVGYDQVTGVHRFNFENAFLYDGFALIPVTLGIFGLAELFDLLGKGKATIAQEGSTSSLAGVFRGVKDVWIHRWLWLRSTLIGYVIGIIPGVGASVATWVCYGQAKQTSKYPEKFGTGVVEGVIAPEAANNAKDAGDMLTTMSFGIPGSANGVLMLAAIMMVGIIPGPAMITEELPLALTLLIGIAIANLLAGTLTLFTAPQLAKIATLHIDYLFTGVMVVAMAGVYVASPSPLQFVVAFIFGLLGLAMKRFGYSRPALLLGFVLGGLFETYSLLSIKIYGPIFFTSPISLSLLGILVIMFALPFLRRKLPGLLRRTR